MVLLDVDMLRTSVVGNIPFPVKDELKVAMITLKNQLSTVFHV